MIYKENYKVVIIIGFLLHQSCYNYALLNTEQPVHIMFFFIYERKQLFL
jgi:hypothetical protein